MSKIDGNLSVGGQVRSGSGFSAPNKSSDMDMLDEVEKVLIYRQQRARVTKRCASVPLDLDNGGSEEHVLAKPPNDYTVKAARIVYVDATSGTVAAAELRIGSTLDGEEIVADSSPENGKAIGTETTLTLVDTDGVSVSGGTAIFLKFTGVSPTAAGKIIVEVDYEEEESADVYADTVDLYSFRKDGKVTALQVFLDSAPTDTRTVTIDLQRGSEVTAFATILQTTLTIDDGTSDKEVVNKAIYLPDFSAGETLRLVVTRGGASGNWPTGIVVNVTVRDEPN